MSLFIALAVVAVLLVFALMPAKKGRDLSELVSPLKSHSFRQQQADEEAEAVASVFRRKSEEAWEQEVSDKAAAMLKAGAASKKT